MPPKKKKSLVNPIVVGTVSTRSTRRQSIVNIEIPKSSRGKRGKGAAKTLLNREITADISEAKRYTEAENSSLEFIFESSSESEKTDRSDLIDSSDTDAVVKSESKLSLENRIETSIVNIPKSCRSRISKCAAKTVTTNKKVITDISANEYQISEHSSVEVIESSSESERTDRSERIDSSDTDILTKCGSDLNVDNVTKTSIPNQVIVDEGIPKSSRNPIGESINRTTSFKTIVIKGKKYHVKDNVEAECSRLEFIFDSSSESEKTDSDRIDYCDTYAFTKSSELRPETVKASNSELTDKIKHSFSETINLGSLQAESIKDGEESKQALLQILQDWDDDDESQEQMSATSKFDRGYAENKGFENLEFGAEDIREIIGRDSTSTTEEIEVSSTKAPNVIEEGESESIEFIEENQPIEHEVVESHSSTSMYVPSEATDQNQHKSPVVIEESMDTTFGDDNMVGCVIEEIVPDTNEIILTDSNIDSNPSSETQIVSEESRDTSNNTPFLVSEKDSHSLQNEDRVSDVVDTIADVPSEESRSMSTVDSNDAEVRRFFSKEIHNCETVNDEINPANEGLSSSNSGNITLVKEQSIENAVRHSKEEMGEENKLKKEIDEVEVQMQIDMAGGKNTIADDYELQKEQDILTILEDDSTEDTDVTSSNQINSAEETNLQEKLPVISEVPHSVSEKNIREVEIPENSDISGDKNKFVHNLDLKKGQDILSILEDDSEDQDVTTKPVIPITVEDPNCMKEKDEEMLEEEQDDDRTEGRTMEDQLNKMSLGETTIAGPVMTTDEGTIAISIENKIAEMHLDAMSMNQSSEKVAQLNLQDRLTDSESIKDTSSKYSSQECTLLHNSSEQNSEKLKTKETKKISDIGKGSRLNGPKLSKDYTEKLKTSRSEKVSKQINPTKVKEKSKEKKVPKEPKMKKTVSSAPKKLNSKSEKKDKVKTEKKEKKLGKSDISKSENDPDDTEVRRSSRIKFINDSNSTKKITGRGLVKSKSEPSLNSFDCDVSDSSSIMTESGRSTPVASPRITISERNSRWSKSTDNISTNLSTANEMAKMEIDDKPKMPAKDPVVEGRLKQFVHLKENSYKTDRMTCKEAKKMVCDCFLTAEEIEADEYGCGEDCLNRLLMIECGNLCQVGDRCTNKRFQKTQFAPVEVFNTDKKGLGLRAAANIPFGEFILEYVGEVLNSNEFDKRAEVYSQDKNIHYYFMALRADAIIDATMKGNISRFINHSCDPNAETQKWTVNGELRIGFFSTRTILAGEEVTFDYRFQRYGKEAQKCFCGASICRGWLGEEPDSDEDEEEEDEEQTLSTVSDTSSAVIKDELLSSDIKAELEDTEFDKSGDVQKTLLEDKEKVSEATVAVTPAVVPVVKKKVSKKKPRVELFEEIDQLNEEIEMLVTTGLKNQAQTLKLSRLVVRAKDPQQRAKLLRVLRRGELPCRRLFLDYHGLRLIHGYMIDAQHMVLNNKKYESMRLEMLQTLAVLPIPNKSMLQDSKVLSTVELWASDKDLASPLDSDSNSPKTEELPELPTKLKEENTKTDDDVKSVQDQEEEIKFLANKLLEEWKNLKEVFKIPKKERIEQMKEHEREANKKFMQAQNAYEHEQDKEKKNDRYRSLSVRYKIEKDPNRKGFKQGDKPSAEFLKLSKVERRKLFALQHELREEERRMKQRELWRQHEMNCMLMGTDPRFTAPFDPSRGFHCVWNPQIGQWQNYPLPPNTSIYPSQTPPLPNISLPPHQIPKSMPNYSYTPPLPMNTNVGMGIPHGAIPGSLQLPSSTVLPQMPSTLPPTAMPMVQYHESVIEEDPSQVKFMGPIPPPVKLPPKWKCAKDKYGRPYYYHIRLRKSQWEPPPLADPVIDENLDSTESESSSDTSSISSDSSSDNSESDADDTKLLMEVRKQMDTSAKATAKTPLPAPAKVEESLVATPSPEEKISEEDMDLDESIPKSAHFNEDGSQRPSIDVRLRQLDLFKDDKPPAKKRRVGLCEEIIISPRTEEDKKQFKEDVKRYKANKEKLKRQKELILQQTKKQLREIELKKMKEKRSRTSLKAKIKDMPDFNSDAAKKIKETFRANMASTVVNSLNAYRKSDCTEGKITNTEDFKHLARKLTHFVMLKEMKHISKIEELICTDSVKTKAREYIRKYMSKFGEVYVKRNDSPDFKD